MQVSRLNLTLVNKPGSLGKVTTVIAKNNGNISNILFSTRKKDFYDLSICLKELDIIASSDTSIIHLCGILNIKAYLLLNYNSDWRWFFDKDKTIWYPSIQIIKQKKINDWSYVFEKLETELTNLYKNKFKP